MTRSFLTLVFCFVFASAAAAAEKPRVVTTIAPLHSLVQNVLGEEGAASLLIDGSNSPHGFQLKPSILQVINKADVIFYMGNSLESFMPKVVKSGEIQGRLVSMLSQDELHLLKTREGGIWAPHDHGAHEAHNDHDDAHKHDHDEHKHEHADKHDDEGEHKHEHADHDDDHKHEEHADHDDEHKHDEHSDHEREHEHEHEHEHDGEYDPHAWLVPENAIAMVGVIEEVLSEVYPERASIFAKNAANTVEKLQVLDSEIQAQVTPIKSRPFIVLHDAYQYFGSHYDLASVGSVQVQAGQQVSVKRVQELRAIVAERGAVCLFREPQFTDRVLSIIQEGSPVRIGTLDPLGSQITPGADLYFQLMRTLADNLTDCLLPKS